MYLLDMAMFRIAGLTMWQNWTTWESVRRCSEGFSGNQDLSLQTRTFLYGAGSRMKS